MSVLPTFRPFRAFEPEPLHREGERHRIRRQFGAPHDQPRILQELSRRRFADEENQIPPRAPSRSAALTGSAFPRAADFSGTSYGKALMRMNRAEPFLTA